MEQGAAHFGVVHETLRNAFEILAVISVHSPERKHRHQVAFQLVFLSVATITGRSLEEIVSLALDKELPCKNMFTGSGRILSTIHTQVAFKLLTCHRKPHS
jgi:hypothetical protein